MLAPERRTRGDLIAAVAIVLAIAVSATVIWWRSDARATESITATVPSTEPPSAASVPSALRELWRADDGAVDSPQEASGAVITADDGTVTGRDRLTGAELWHYQRDMPLCDVYAEWSDVVAVYRDQRGCGQVTSLRAATGERYTHRTGQADQSIRLSSDGTHMTSFGSTHLELWRWDLVKTVEYGAVEAPVSENVQPRGGCTLLSSASSRERLAVIESCPGDSTDRLTVQNPSPKDAQEPEEYGSTVLIELTSGLPGARVLAVSGERTAVFLPGDGAGVAPRLGVFDGAANPVAQYPLSGPIADNAVVTKYRNDFTIWTGTDVVFLDSATMTPTWTFPGALGPGTEMAGSILVPVAGGIVALDPRTGTERLRIPVERGDVAAPITLGVVGDTVLEQRGSELVALGPN